MYVTEAYLNITCTKLGVERLFKGTFSAASRLKYCRNAFEIRRQFPVFATSAGENYFSIRRRYKYIFVRRKYQQPSPIITVTGKSLKFHQFSDYCSADFGPSLPANQLYNNQNVYELETYASDCRLFAHDHFSKGHVVVCSGVMLISLLLDSANSAMETLPRCRMNFATASSSSCEM